MRSFDVSYRLFGQELRASVQITAEGIAVLLTGGTHEHIGAVSIVTPEGEATTTVFAAHRDDAVSRTWAERLRTAGLYPAVVMVGIHYDGMSPTKIERIIRCTDRMFSQVQNIITKETVILHKNT